MKRIIAIVAGGDSTEYGVSLRSAQGVMSFLDMDRYEPYLLIIHAGKWRVSLPSGVLLDVDRNDFSFMLEGRKVRFDYAYIIIHGHPGEDGCLQGYFNLMGIPYSGCTLMTSALTFDKFICSQYLHTFGVRIAESMRILKGSRVDEDLIVSTVGLPCFVKPSGGGSSFGVTKVKKASELQAAIDKAFTEADQVIAESFLDGREFSCGCYATPQGLVALPATEVISQNEFFDYDAKYNGQVREVTPAEITPELMNRIQSLTRAIYGILQARGIIRVDYIITQGDKINLLEVNTTPGMTATSFIPQQVRAAGLDIRDVMTTVIESSFPNEN